MQYGRVKVQACAVVESLIKLGYQLLKKRLFGYSHDKLICDEGFLY
jgi:hypothetical protein